MHTDRRHGNPTLPGESTMTSPGHRSRRTVAAEASGRRGRNRALGRAWCLRFGDPAAARVRNRTEPTGGNPVG